MFPFGWIQDFMFVKMVLKEADKYINRLKFRNVDHDTEEWSVLMGNLALYDESLALHIRGSSFSAWCGCHGGSCHCSLSDPQTGEILQGFSKKFADEIEYEMRIYFAEVESERRLKMVIERAYKKAIKQWRR